MLEFFDGIPIKIVCGNLKTITIKYSKDEEIILNNAYKLLT